MRTVSDPSGDNIKCTNIWIMGNPEKEEKQEEKKKEKAKNISNLRKKIVTQVQEVQRIPQKIEHKEEYAETNINQTNKN